MKREIKSTAHIGHCAEFLTQNSCVLDIETDSRYWRTSHFNNVRLADTEKEIIWIPEKESDEYDLLITLAESLSQYSHIVTFSGTGFDLPHLRKKYSAYRLSDPLQDKRHDDLFLMLRKYNALLPLARHRLNDYVSLGVHAVFHFDYLGFLGCQQFIQASVDLEKLSLFRKR